MKRRQSVILNFNIIYVSVENYRFVPSEKTWNTSFNTIEFIVINYNILHLKENEKAKQKQTSEYYYWKENGMIL